MKTKHYLLFVWGCVEPELIGPFDTAGEVVAEVDSYGGDELEEEEE